MGQTAPSRFHVNPSSGVPIYRQLMDQVRAQATGGRLSPGDFLPSVRHMADALEVNTMTVSKAYSLLEREGVLARVRGTGMAVASPVGWGAGRAVRERQRQLRPLLEAAVRRAHELDLSRSHVIDALGPLLKELRDE